MNLEEKNLLKPETIERREKENKESEMIFSPEIHHSLISLEVNLIETVLKMNLTPKEVEDIGLGGNQSEFYEEMELENDELIELSERDIDSNVRDKLFSMVMEIKKQIDKKSLNSKDFSEIEILLSKLRRQYKVAITSQKIFDQIDDYPVYEGFSDTLREYLANDLKDIERRLLESSPQTISEGYFRDFIKGVDYRGFTKNRLESFMLYKELLTSSFPIMHDIQSLEGEEAYHFSKGVFDSKIMYEIWSEEYIDKLSDCILERILQSDKKEYQISEIGAGFGHLSMYLNTTIKEKLKEKGLDKKISFLASDDMSWRDSIRGTIYPVEDMNHEEALDSIESDLVIVSWPVTPIIIEEIRKRGVDYIHIGRGVMMNESYGENEDITKYLPKGNLSATEYYFDEEDQIKDGNLEKGDYSLMSVSDEISLIQKEKNKDKSSYADTAMVDDYAKEYVMFLLTQPSKTRIYFKE